MIAAVYGEGMGGSREFIDYLCEEGGDIESKSFCNQSCLHVAFETGNEQTISAVRSHIWEKQLQRTQELPEQEAAEALEAVEVAITATGATPLEVGIEGCRMKKDALARAAAPTIGSMKVFIHKAPECIPSFTSRLRETMSEGELSAQLSQKFSVEDIARLLHDFPDAAATLLEAATCQPRVESPGRHPLPARISFTSSWLQKWFKTSMPCLYFYTHEASWSFDESCSQAPHWHQRLTDLKEPPMRDTKIQVCSIPDLISPIFFSAILSGDESLFLFNCVAVRAAVGYTFWNGSACVEAVQTSISAWGLVLLVLETLMSHEEIPGLQSTTGLSAVFEPSFVKEGITTGVVADWIIAKGLVDVFLELAELAGCYASMKGLGSYFRPGNFWDVTRSLLPILLLWHYESRALQVCVILIYWMRLLEGVMLSRQIGYAFLPLHKLAAGLLPAISFTLLGFCAFSHAMYVVRTRADEWWPQTLWHSFTTLITQGLPKDPPEDQLELIVLYGSVLCVKRSAAFVFGELVLPDPGRVPSVDVLRALSFFLLGEVLFFSVFVMNIFIGVISEQYASEKKQVHLAFQSLRASSCLTFLMRVSVIPCCWLTKETAALMASGSVILAFTLQVCALCYGWQLPGIFQLMVFIGCQLTIFLSSLQCKGSDNPWTAWTNSSLLMRPLTRQKRYLWICTWDFCDEAKTAALELSREEDPEHLLEKLRMVVRKSVELDTTETTLPHGTGPTLLQNRRQGDTRNLPLKWRNR
ncbi:unnamed protein product [Durusdinium trenchii]|uniref:Uncharacterized protein n=1 Tax=Durusdinium trenchii TaxID=1381693 RepID=A0ABP0S2Z4_9DINO